MSSTFPRVVADEIFLKHFPRVDRNQRRFEGDETGGEQHRKRCGTGVASRGGKVAPLQVLLQFCGSELRARNGRQLNLNIQLCDV